MSRDDLVEKLARESDPQAIAKLICDALDSMARELAEAREENEKRVNEINGKAVRRWHEAWAPLGVRGAYGCIQTLRRVIG